MNVAGFDGDWPEGYGPAPVQYAPNVVPINDDTPPSWMDEIPPVGEPVREPEPITATLFEWRPENEIPARQWLYGKHLLRRFVSVDVAAGGTGKSSVKIGEALAMAANRDLYGVPIHGGPLSVWLYNLEDPAEESERRIHAAAKWFKIAPEELANRLYVDSGRDQRCVIATETEYGARIAQPVYDQIRKELIANAIDVLIVDPFVSSHEVSENDNRAFDAVAKAWGRLADECNCSINLVHHVRKGNGQEANADSARGAKALVDAARSVQVFNRMSPDEASLAGVAEDQRGFYFRVQNDKANLAPPDKAAWYRMNNVSLDNGDQVGVACPWKWPELFDGLSTRHLIAVQKVIETRDWRLDQRSEQWVGFAVAQALDYDAEATKKRILGLLKEWVKNGSLEVVEKEDEQRRPRKFVVVGRWAQE